MSESYAVYITGLSDKEELANLTDDVRIAARRAVNYATTRAKTAASKRMREQIAWTATYIDQKMEVRLSSGDKFEGKIDVSFRPTSLARFVVGAKTPWKAGVRLHVGTASYTQSRRMFIVPLKRGNADITEDNRNLGLAIRLKPGETVKGKYKTKQLGKGLYLLYGPSVSQVFFTVAEDILPDAQVWVNDEFERQIELLGKSK